MPERDLPETLRAMDESATPASALVVHRYDHGGARVTADNNLIADFYDADNRECFIRSRNALPALAAFVEAGDGMSVALSKCDDLFSEIRGDWTDPRSDCREGWKIVAEARANYDAARAALASAIEGGR